MPCDCTINEEGLTSITVKLIGDVKESVDVSIDDQDMATIGSAKGKKNTFEFAGLDAAGLPAGLDFADGWARERHRPT